MEMLTKRLEEEDVVRNIAGCLGVQAKEKTFLPS